MWKRVTALFMCYIFLFSQFVFSIGVSADPNAPDNKKPDIRRGTSINPNIPVVNIAPPDGSGVSHNLYQRFNINNYGLILNNSTSPTETVLGGYIDGNPRLMGRSAGLIINEVTGSERSLLFGTLEVAGQPADVIIANINGITVNGAGFINVNRLTLTTGEIIYNKSFEGIEVKGGDILIEGTGLKAGSTNTLFILSKSARVEGEVKGSEINFILGSNQFNNNFKLIKVIDSEGKKRWAFSSLVLGGIYGDRIRIVVTEKGAGVNAQGSLVASEDINIDSRGNVILNNAKSGSSLKVISKEGNIDLKGQVSSAEAELSANKNVINEGTIKVSVLKTKNLINKSIIKSEILESGGNNFFNEGNVEVSFMEVKVREFKNKGDINSENILLSSDDFLNSGNMEVSEAMVINSLSTENRGYLKGKTISLEGKEIENRGYIETQELTTVNSDEFINKGSIKSETLSIDALSVNNASKGTLEGKTISINSQNLLNEGSIKQVGAEEENILYIKSENFDNKGSVSSENTSLIEVTGRVNNSGNLNSESDMVIYSNTLANSGEIKANKSLYIAGIKKEDKEGNNPNLALELLNTGTIESESVVLLAENLNNGKEGTINGSNIYIESKKVNNKGAIKQTEEGNILYIKADELQNSGNIESEGDTVLEISDINNTGNINSISNITLLTNELDNEGNISSAKTLTIMGISKDSEKESKEPPKVSKIENKGSLRGQNIIAYAKDFINKGKVKARIPIHTKFKLIEVEYNNTQRNNENSNETQSEDEDEEDESQNLGIYIKADNLQNSGDIEADTNIYLEVKDKITNTGNIISREDILIYAGTEGEGDDVKLKRVQGIENEGTIKGNNTSVITENLQNLGDINANDFLLVEAFNFNYRIGSLNGKKIALKTATIKQDVFDYLKPSEALHLESLRDDITFQDLNYTFNGDLSIKSAKNLQISNSNLKANNLALSANNDLVLYNSDAVAKDTLSLSTTEGDIKILAEVKEETKSWSSREKRGNDFSYVDEKKNVTEKRITYDTSYLEGKNVQISSGGSVLVEGADINAKGGDVIVKAKKDINFKALKNVYERHENKEKLHFSLGVNYRKDNIKIYEKREEVVSSDIKGKNIYLISEEGGIKIEGATYKSDNLIYAKAKGNIEIVPVSYVNDKIVDENYDYFIARDGRDEVLKSYEFKDPNLISENDIQIISDQTVRIIGAKVDAKNSVLIDAGKDIQIVSVKEIKEHHVKEAGQFNLFYTGTFLIPVDIEDGNISFASYRKEERGSYSEELLRSSIKANIVALRADGNIDILGSQVEGTKGVAVEAGGDVNLIADLVKQSSYSKLRKDTVSIGFNASKEEISVYGGIKSKYSSQKNTLISAAGSLIRGGGVSIKAGGNLNLIGSDIEAGVLEIEATDVNLLDVYEIQSSESFYQEFTAGIRAGVRQNVTSAIDSVKAVGNSSNAVSGTFNTLKAVDSVSSAVRTPVSANVGFFAETTTSSSSSYAKTSRGSSIKAVTATINASGDVYLRGSDIYASESLDITANNLILENSLNELNSSSFSTRASASYSLMGTDQGLAKLSYSQVKSKSNAVLVKGSSIKTKNLKLNIKNDVNIKGSRIESETAEGNIGGDLIVETVLSKRSSSSESYSVSLSNGGSLNTGFGVQYSDSAMPDIQAGFVTTSDFNINVEGNVYLKGGVAGSLQAGKTNLTANDIIAEDVQGYSRNFGFNINVGVNINPNNPDQTGEITNLAGNITDYDADITALASLGTGNIKVNNLLPPNLNRDLNNTIIVDVNKNLNLDFYYSPSSIRSVLDPVGTLETWKHNALKNYIKGGILVTNVDDLFTKGISFTALRVSKGFKAVDSVASLTLGDSIIEKIINNAVKSSAEEFYYAVDQTAKNAQDHLIENNEDYADLYLYQGSQINNPNDEKGLLSDQAGGYNTKDDEIYINTEATPIHEGSEIVRVIYTEVQRRDNNLNHGDLSKEEQTELAYYVGDIAANSWLLLSDGPDEEYTHQDAIEWNEFVKDTQLFKEGNRRLSQVNPKDVEHLPAIVVIAIAAGVAISDAWDIYDAYKEGGEEEAVKVAAEKLLEIPNPLSKFKKVFKLGKRAHKLYDQYKKLEKLDKFNRKTLSKIRFDKAQVVGVNEIHKLRGIKEGVYLMIHEDTILYVGQSGRIFRRCKQHKCNNVVFERMRDILKKQGKEFEEDKIKIVAIPMEGATKFERELTENGVLRKFKRQGFEVVNKKDPVDFESKYEVYIEGEKFNRGEVGENFYEMFKEVYDQELKELINLVLRSNK